MRTCLPSASRAKAMASCEPIESPSGRAWEVRRKRWRPRISSLIWSTTAASAGASPTCCSLLIRAGVVDIAIIFTRFGKRRLPLGFGTQSLQDLFDAVVLLDRLVEHPGELGHTFELEPPSDVTPQEGRGALQRLGRVFPRLGIANRGVEDTRLLQVGRHLDVGDGEKADPRVVDLAGEQFGELSADLVTDTGGSGSLRHEFLKQTVRAPRERRASA